MVDTKYDYDEDLDILHIYTSDIDSGIKGGLTYGNFNIDIGENDKIVGIELEGASALLNISPEILANLDNVMLIVKRTSDILFIGFTVIKDQQKSTIQINIPTKQKVPISVSN